MILAGQRVDGGRTLELTRNTSNSQDVLAMVAWQVVVIEGQENLLPVSMIEMPLTDDVRRDLNDGFPL